MDGHAFDGPEAEQIPVDEYVMLARQGRMQEMRSRWMQHPMMTMGVSCEEERALLRTMLADYKIGDSACFACSMTCGNLQTRPLPKQLPTAPW